METPKVILDFYVLFTSFAEDTEGELYVLGFA